MSKKEIDRLAVIRDVEERKITQKEAGQRLHLSNRHVRRLIKPIVAQNKRLGYKHPVDVFSNYYDAVETEVINEL